MVTFHKLSQKVVIIINNQTKSLGFIIILIGLFISMILTNPNKQDFVQYAEEQILESNSSSAIKVLTQLVSSQVISAETISNNYIVFSVYRNSFSPDVKYIGVFNNFIVLEDNETGAITPSSKSNQNREKVLNAQPTKAASSEAYIPELQPVENDKEGYWNYHNPRYGFNVDYPYYFLRANPPINGDGQQFFSPDGKIEITVYGCNVYDETTIEDEYNNLLNHNKDGLSFKKLSDNWFAVSWIDEGIIYYQKTFTGVGSKNTFLAKYPEESKEEGNHVVERMEASFRPGDLDNCH